MDPNGALQRIRAIVSDWEDPEGSGLDAWDMERALELFSGLDQWLTNGGYLPAEWQGRNA